MSTNSTRLGINSIAHICHIPSSMLSTSHVIEFRLHLDSDILYSNIGTSSIGYLTKYDTIEGRWSMADLEYEHMSHSIVLTLNKGAVFLIKDIVATGESIITLEFIVKRDMTASAMRWMNRIKPIDIPHTLTVDVPSIRDIAYRSLRYHKSQQLNNHLK